MYYWWNSLLYWRYNCATFKSHVLKPLTTSFFFLCTCMFVVYMQTRGRQRKKSRTPPGEISWNQVDIMRNQSRFPWNQTRKSAQLYSSTHFYNIWRHFWGKSWGNQREIRKSCTPKLLVADPSYADGITAIIYAILLFEWQKDTVFIVMAGMWTAAQLSFKYVCW